MHSHFNYYTTIYRICQSRGLIFNKKFAKKMGMHYKGTPILFIIFCPSRFCQGQSYSRPDRSSDNG